MNNPKKIRMTVLATAIAAACALANAQDLTLYESHVLPDALLFEPNNTIGMNSDIDIVVKGPNGFMLRQSFQAGEPIEFNPLTANEGGLPDGTYRYELQITGIKGVAADRSGNHPKIAQSLEPGFGAFTILDGKLVSRDIEEFGYQQEAQTAASASSTPQKSATDEEIGTRQLFTQDVEIQGSLCVGQDCVNGESFGFDTIRLKENNLRIKFQDTSNSASFPSNDWQLTANDSTNGGQNKFSIDDVDGGRTPFTLEAGAPSHSLYVDDGGRIGFGTSTPVVENHIVDGDSPTVRLQQDGSSGFTAQTWDMAGNEANFFIRDVTNGSRLPFRIQPSAPSDSLYISSTGDIGLGTSSPDVPGAHIKSTGRAALFIEAGADEQSDISLGDTGLARFIIRTRATTHNFEISRRAENGGSLDRPFLIPFATGIAQFENGLNLVSDDEPPTPNSGALLFVDNATGDLMVKFANGTLKTLLTD